jgi:hypothetical protein
MFCFQTLDYITISTLPPTFFFIKRIIWIEVFVQLFTRCLVCCGVIMHAQLIRQIMKVSLTEMVNNSPNINKTSYLKKTMIYVEGYSCPRFSKAQTCGECTPTNWIPQYPLNNWIVIDNI